MAVNVNHETVVFSRLILEQLPNRKHETLTSEVKVSKNGVQVHVSVFCHYYYLTNQYLNNLLLT